MPMSGCGTCWEMQCIPSANTMVRVADADFYGGIWFEVALLYLFLASL